MARIRRHGEARHGFTLVGILVGMCLLLVVFALAYNLLSFGARTSKSGMDMAEASTIAYLMMEGITNELKESSRVVYPRQNGVASWITLAERDGRHKVVFLDKKEGILKHRYLDEKKPKVLSRYAKGRALFVKHLRFHHIKGSEVVIKMSLARAQKPETTMFQLVSSFTPRHLY